MDARVGRSLISPPQKRTCSKIADEKDLHRHARTETNTFASIPTGHQLFEETCLFRKGSYGKNVPMFGQPLAIWRGRAEPKAGRWSKACAPSPCPPARP